MVSLQLDSVLRRFGGSSGLHARLSKSRYTDGTISEGTIRAWKSRGAIPGQMTLPIMLLLRDEGEDPFDFVSLPEPDPFEGLK